MLEEYRRNRVRHGERWRVSGSCFGADDEEPEDRTEDNRKSVQRNGTHQGLETIGGVIYPSAYGGGEAY